jgi:RNA polymerase sigma-70 factor (ECF subfamily)
VFSVIPPFSASSAFSAVNPSQKIERSRRPPRHYHGGPEMAVGQAILSESILIADAGADLVESLVREHARFVYRVAYAVLRNHHDAEDAVQETFIRVWRHRGELRGIQEARPWLARIAWRVAVDKRRRPADVSLDAQEESARGVRELRDHGAAADELAMSAQMQALLASLISSLPRDLREVVTLSTVEDLTSAEVGAALGIPEVTVRTRLFRARQLLKEKLAAVMEGGS